MLILRCFQMTDTMKEEMRRYKALAVKVEESLRERQLVKHQDKYVPTDRMEPVDKLKSIGYSSDSDVSSHDVAVSDSPSKMTIVEPELQDAGETKDNHDIQSSISNVQHSQLKVCPSNDTVNDSESIAVTTDQDKYVDVTEVSTPNEDITLADSWKPEVPRTLDIVPIMLSNDEEDTSSSTGISKETENPKLSRQGSYILDTPSPMLLAHMHTELIDNYIPTRTPNVSQRKQWNIVQPKVEWENKQFMAEDVEALSKLESTGRKSTSQHRESDSSTELRQPNKTISTKAVIEEDAYISDVTPTKRRSNSDFKKQSSLEKSEKDTSVLNLSSREYTEDASSPKNQLSRIDEKQHNEKESVTEYWDSNINTKSSTPDKLLMVYKEIEEMHKKQMMELVYRQRKEQSLLQAEFQKQQMLLLTEIRKCASGVPRRANASNAVLNRSLSNDETSLIGHEARQHSNINSPINLHAEEHCNIKLPLANRVIVCPLDYLSSRNLYLLKHHSADNSPATLDFDFTRKVSLCDTAYYNNNNNNNNNNNSNNDDNSSCESNDLIVYKNSNVSRQLFPLDSNTTHIPVLDTTYLDKHVSNFNFTIFNILQRSVVKENIKIPLSCRYGRRISSTLTHVVT